MTIPNRLLTIACFAVAAALVAVTGGCGTGTSGIKILTPYGEIDTSGTTTLDLRGLMAPPSLEGQGAPLPAPKSYNLDLMPLPTLEK